MERKKMEKRTTSQSCLSEIANLLARAGSVLIFPHIQMDGDALGSSVALCRALRNRGKVAQILIEDKIPENLRFLDKGYCIYDFPDCDPDVCIALDCSDLMRIDKRQEIFLKGKQTALLDHHATSQPFADINYVDIDASSTGEIVFLLLKEMGATFDREMGEALFAAIITDTGNFLYSNTGKRTHLMAAELYETGMDHNKVAVEIYQRKRIQKIKIMNAVLSTIELIHEGKGCVAVMTRRMLADTGAFVEETEGVVEELRNIDGVEISAFLREEEGRVRVTMRAKGWADVSDIAEKYGGGGHKKAAGCTIPGTIEEVKPLLIQDIKWQLDKPEGR